MRGSFKFGLGLGVLVLMASAAPACSSSDDSGSGGKHTGGTGGGGTGGGGTGGAAGSGGSTGGASGGGGTGGATSLTCGTKSCDGWTIKGLLSVSPCCAGSAKDACGAQVDSTISQLIGIPQGCYPLNEPGNQDCGCKPFTFANPIPPPDTGEFNGCCRTDGTCGVFIDLTSLQGPNMGCQDGTKFMTDGGTPATCTVGQETPPPADPDGGTGLCPVTDGGGTGGAAGATGDASAD